MIRVWQDFDENCRPMWGKWFGTLSRDGHVIANVGPFETEAECRAALGDNGARIEGRHGYCAEAVEKAIAASNRAGRRIGRAERNAIHRLLKGR